MHRPSCSVFTTGASTHLHFAMNIAIAGSTKFIDNLIQEMDKRPAYLMNATQCLPLKSTIRNVTGTYLQGVKAEDLVYVHFPRGLTS